MMYNATNGAGLGPDRAVKASTVGSGQRVRKALSVTRSTSDGLNSASSLTTASIIDRGTTSAVGDYLSDSVDECDEEDLGSEEVDDLDDNTADASFVISSDHVDSADLQRVDPETRARLQALLEAAGLAGKFTASDTKVIADADVVRRLTSVTCALNRVPEDQVEMNTDGQGQSDCNNTLLSLAQACTSGDVEAVRLLLKQGSDIREGTEDGDSLLSLAASAGYYELCQILIAMKANVEDKGLKGDCTPLMEAASAGYADIVQLLIANGADVNAKSTAGNTALHYAACNGHEEVVRVLVQAGANVEEHNENGHTPLMEAASAGFVGIAKIFLSAGAGINTHSNEFKESALTLACYKGHLEMVKFLLEAGADQEHKTDEMHTALMEASMDGHVEVAKLLLDHGAQVNMPADSFESPLTLAACGGHVELANLLIERGANLEEANDEGYTPLMEAAREGHEEMVALLLAHGADINAQTDETQETALTLACCGGFLEVADFLIKAGADIELGSSTPLMEAAQEGHLELVKYLLKANANVHAQTQTGDTALTYACENGHTDVAEVLLEHGAELEHEAEGGRTALMKAARVGHQCTVQYLILQGADVNKSTTNNEHTVLSLACAGGHHAVVEMLLKNGANAMHKLKDGSTMLIEAAKGGHATVVNLLLDWSSNAGNSRSSNSSEEPCQTSPSQFTLDLQQVPRVPIQGLTNIVPPHDPSASFADSAAAVHGLDASSFVVQPPDFGAAFSGMLPVTGGYTWVTADGSQFTGVSTAVNDHSSCCRFAADSLSAKITSEHGELSSTSSVDELEKEFRKKCSTLQASAANTGTSETSAMATAAALTSLLATAPNSGNVTVSGASEQLRDLLTLIASKKNEPQWSVAPADEQVVVNDRLIGEELQTSINKLLVNFPNTPSVVQLLGLSPSAPLTDTSLISLTNPVPTKNVASSVSTASDTAPHVMSLATKSSAARSEPMVTSGGLAVDVSSGLMTYGDAGGPAKSGLVARLECTGDGDGTRLLLSEQVDDTCCHHSYQTAAGSRLQVVGAGDDVDVSTVALLSDNTTDVQLHELFMQQQQQQQQWQLHLGHMMQLDVVQQQTQPLVVGAETASLLWHQQQPADQLVHQQLLLQPQHTTSLDTQQITKPSDQQQMQSPRQQKNRQFARAQRKLTYPNQSTQNHQQQQQQQQQQHVSLLPTNYSHLHTGGVLPSADSDKSQLIWQQRVVSSIDSHTANVDNQAATSAAQIRHNIGQPLVLHHYQQQPQQQLPTAAAYCLPTCDVQSASSQYLQQHEIAKQLQYQLAHAQAAQLQQLVFQQQQQHLVLHQSQQTNITPNQTQQLMQFHQLTPSQQLAAQKRLAHLQQSPHGILETGVVVPQTHGAVTVSQTLLGGQTLSGGVVLPQTLGGGAVMPMTFDGGGIAPMMSIPVAVNSSAVKMSNKTGQFHFAPQQAAGQPLLNGLDAQLLKTPMPGFDFVDPTSAPLSPNPPASPLMTPPVYPMSIEVDAQTEGNHDTALTLACAGGHTELVTLLLSRGANIEHRDKKGFTPLIHAATAGHVAVVEILLDHGADIEAQSERTKDTPLSLACSGGRYEVVELLLQRGANREHRNVSDYTPLALAASGGYVNIIRLLLSHGAEINSRTGSKLGISPLMLAAMNGHAQAVSLLVDMGSDINAQIETNRNTALTLACFQGRHEVVSILVDKRANIEHRAKTGLTPLMEAASGGYVEVGRVLLDKGADIAAAPVPSSRDTALTIAADKGHYRFVELLVSRNAAVDARNKKGQTALWLACNGGHLDVVQLLVSARADADAQDNRKVSCLMAAFRRGHVKVVRWLVRHVAQFPSDPECQRYMAAVTDADLQKRCTQCMEAIVSAKERQAAEANKNAAVLLEELDAERSREESRRAKLAKKREKKRQKKRERQGRDSEPGDVKTDPDDDLDRNDDDSSEEMSVQSVNDPVTLEMVKVQEAAQNERERVTATLSEPVENGRTNIKKTRKSKKKAGSPVDKSMAVTANQTVNDVLCQLPLTNSDKMNTLFSSVSLENEHMAISQSVKSVLLMAQPCSDSSKLSSVPPSIKTCLSTTEAGKQSIVTTQIAKVVSLPQQSSGSDEAKQLSYIATTKSLQTSLSEMTKQSNAVYSSAVKDGSMKQKDSLGQPQVNSKTSGKGKDVHQLPTYSTLIPNSTSTGIGDLDDFGTLPASSVVKVASQISVGRERTDALTLQTAAAKVVSSATRQPRSAQTAAVNTRTSSATVTAASNSSKKTKTGTGNRKDDDPNRKCQRIAVPAKAISRIIGRAGCNINAIRDATGAQVDLDKLKNSADAVVTIRGSADASRVAHDLVVALIRESDKDIDQLIPQMKIRQGTVTAAPQTCVVVPAPPPPDNVWKSNMAKSIPASAILAQSVAVSSTASLPVVKPSLSATVVTKVTQSVNSSVSDTSNIPVDDMAKPQPIGAFPIGAWTPVSVPSKRSNSHNSSAAPGHGRRDVSTSKSSNVDTVPAVSLTSTLISMSETTAVSDSLLTTVSVNGTPHVAEADSSQPSMTFVTTTAAAVTSFATTNTTAELVSASSMQSAYSPFNCRFIGNTPMQFGGITVVSSSSSCGVSQVEQSTSSIDAEALQAKAPGYRPQVRTTSPRVSAEATKRVQDENVKLPSPSVDVSSSVSSLVTDANRSFLAFSDGVDVASLLTPTKSIADSMNAMSRVYTHEEYSSSKNPMTLPRIGSNLNPNAPDFTFRMSIANDAPSEPFMFQPTQPQLSFQLQFPPPPPPTLQPPTYLHPRQHMYNLPNTQPNISTPPPPTHPFHLIGPRPPMMPRFSDPPAFGTPFGLSGMHCDVMPPTSSETTSGNVSSEAQLRMHPSNMFANEGGALESDMSTTSPNSGAVYLVDDKRTTELSANSVHGFEERRSLQMQPIGTERQNKKPRTTTNNANVPSFPFVPSGNLPSSWPLNPSMLATEPDWMKVPPSSSTSGQLTASSNETDEPSQIQQMLMTMPHHAMPPQMGQRMAVPPIGPPGSMAYPRGGLMTGGLQHANHIPASESALEHMNAMMSMSRAPMYHNGLANQMNMVPNTGNMYPAAPSVVGRTDGGLLDTESWSNVPMKLPMTTAAPPPATTDPRPMPWSNIWTSRPNF